MPTFSYTIFIASATFLAISSFLLNAKIDGPEPEIPHPKAPAFNRFCFTLSKAGIKVDR